MNHLQQFAEAVRKEIRRDMNNFTDDLANGVCQSFDQYQKLCGVIRGLALAEDHLMSLLKKAENSDE